MHQTVELVVERRRAMRRAVSLECEVLSDRWEDPVPHVATEISPYGAWLETPFPLDLEEEVVLTLRPPRWRSGRELCVEGVVRRVRQDSEYTGMGIEFVDVPERIRAELSVTLRGFPPPLPPTGTRPHLERKRLWVDEVGR